MTFDSSAAIRRESSRLLEAGSRRVLDSATRQRRLNKQLEALEKDNFQVMLYILHSITSISMYVSLSSTRVW